MGMQRLAKSCCHVKKETSRKAKSKHVLSDEDQQFYNLGFVTLPNREGVTDVTNELVNGIREKEGIQGMVALHDVNMLIELIDSAHKVHRTAKDWALKNGALGWASCH